MANSPLGSTRWHEKVRYMENDESELAIYVDANGAMVVGNDADVEALLRIICAGAQPKARTLAKDALSAAAGAAGLASHAQHAGGRWVQLTAESSARLTELGVTSQVKGGVLAGSCVDVRGGLTNIRSSSCQRELPTPS